MTEQQAMRMALEALEADELDMIQDSDGHMVFRREVAITALRQALEQAEKQEFVKCQYGNSGYACCEGGPCKADEQNNLKAEQKPVAWMDADDNLFYTEEDAHKTGVKPIRPLMTRPQPAEPDLLNALKRIVDEPNNTMSDGKALKEIIRIARSAITRATGEQA